MMNNQTVKARQLSKKEYNQLRKTTVQDVYKSDSQTIQDVANKHNIGTSTLWGWCQQDLGPRQINKVKSKTNKLRGLRIAKQHKEKIRIKNAPHLNNLAKISLLKAKGLLDETTHNQLNIATVKSLKEDAINLGIFPKNKPWDKKKARMNSTERQVVLKDIIPDEDAKDFRSSINKPTQKTLPTYRKTMGPYISINIDANGKLINYEVTGDVNVFVFTQTEHTSNLTR